MNLSDPRHMFRQLRSSGVILALLLFGLVLLGVYVVRGHWPSHGGLAWQPTVAGERAPLHPAALDQYATELEQMMHVAPTDARPAVPYDAQTLRDPFVGPLHLSRARAARQGSSQPAGPTAQTTPPPLTVQGVIWGVAPPCAIVNNEYHRVGDVIEGAELVRIEPDGIVVKFQGMEMRYRPGGVSTVAMP